MAAPDMEVIKDIPGYKVILKAVLKSQIQTLVEQLASTTDEESVILTASVVDGTLSHLGSSSGKVFLEDHEDIKSQFLGFCLKHHHKQKQEKERREAQEREEAMQRSMQAMRQQQQARFSSPGRQGYPHPMGMVRAAGPARMRTPPLRHQPYPMSRPQRPARSPGHAQPSTPSKIDGQIIKIEPEDNSNQSESDNVQTQDPSGTGSGSTETSQPSSPLVKPATPSHGPGASDNDDGESSNSTIPLNDGSDLKLSDTNPPGGLSLDSDLSNIIAASTSGDTNNEQQQQQGVNYDPNISVKLENVSGDPEMDLEITGVELGQRPVPEPSGSQEWMANVQDYMQGATGSAADMSTNQQGYSSTQTITTARGRPSLENIVSRGHVCEFCSKIFPTKWKLETHRRIHTGDRPFRCPYCDHTSNTKGNLRVHLARHLSVNK